MLSRFRSSQASTQEKTQEIKWFGRTYSIGKQTTNKLTTNQKDYKSVSITRISNRFISIFLTLSFLFSPLTLFCSRHTRRERLQPQFYCSNSNFLAALSKREGVKRINRVQELNTWATAELGLKPNNLHSRLKSATHSMPTVITSIIVCRYSICLPRAS
jgi:hypothetical protein